MHGDAETLAGQENAAEEMTKRRGMTFENGANSAITDSQSQSLWSNMLVTRANIQAIKIKLYEQISEVRSDK